jgi:anti-anti-sigma regulatory factor
MGLALFSGMVRIQKIVESPTETTLSAEGRIVAEWVAVLEHECREALRDTLRVQLDLAAVTFIDARGIEMLRRLVTEGVAVVNCREFIDTLLSGDRDT